MNRLFQLPIDSSMKPRKWLLLASLFAMAITSSATAQTSGGDAGVSFSMVVDLATRTERFVYDPARPRPVRSQHTAAEGLGGGGMPGTSGMPGGGMEGGVMPGGAEGGGSGMSGPGGFPGSGTMGLGSSGYGSAAGGLGTGGGLPPGAVVVSPTSILIQAAIGPEHVPGKRDKIELYIQNPQRLAERSAAVRIPQPFGGSMFVDYQTGMSGGIMLMGESSGGYGESNGGAIEFDTPLSTEVYNREHAAFAKQNGRVYRPLLDGELEAAGKLIKLQLWRETALIDLQVKLKTEQGNDENEEKLLKEILREEYDALLERQKLELTRVEKRIKEIQADIARRAAARDRVVEVQIGKIVLESQGLLNSK